LFQGIGNNVVVDFKEGESLRQRRIPNDSIIGEKKSSLLKKDKSPMMIKIAFALVQIVLHKWNKI